MKREYGIQMYSVRDITDKDMRGALKAVAEMGYSFVEFAGFFGHSAEEIKGMLNEYHLKVSGTHTGLSELIDDYAGTVKYHQAIGNRNIIIPGHDLSSQEKLDEFVKTVSEMIPRLQKDGITLGYHNHSHEFMPNQDGSLIYDQIISRTQLSLEIDTYWAFNAGKDPVALIEKLKDRLIFIHIKDGDGQGEGYPLGRGQAPVKAVYQKAVQMNVPMVVESETLKPDGLTEAKVCVEYLRSLE